MLGRMIPHILHHLMMGNRADSRNKGLVLHLLSPKRSNNEKVTVSGITTVCSHIFFYLYRLCTHSLKSGVNPSPY